MLIELDHFRPHNRKEKKLIEKAVEKFVFYATKKAAVDFK